MSASTTSEGRWVTIRGHRVFIATRKDKPTLDASNPSGRPLHQKTYHDHAKNFIVPHKTDAVHYGDGGAADDTMLDRMSGQRGTGHFGTGTYFLGHERGGDARQGRPKLYLDPRGLNLLTPGSTELARTLHDSLREINRAASDPSIPLAFGLTDPLHKPAFTTWLLAPATHTEKGILDAMKSAIASARRDYATLSRNYHAQVDQRSASTRFLQSLGYDGVDVRGTDLDNTDYGSVIFVKPRKP